MKSILLLVAASLMLVGATIVVAIPNPVEANSGWCFGFECEQSKSACEEKFGKGNCFKAPNKKNLN
jgi:hypothetical protein